MSTYICKYLIHISIFFNIGRRGTTRDSLFFCVFFNLKFNIPAAVAITVLQYNDIVKYKMI